MSDDNLISLETYRKENQDHDYRRNALSEVFNKDLREQADLMQWYRIHRIINKYKLFVHTLFCENHIRKGLHLNAGFVAAYNASQLESCAVHVWRLCAGRDERSSM
jgi:hypothetical protein